MARAEGKSYRADRIEDLKIPVEIQLANETDFPHQGILNFIDNKVDPQTGTISVRGRFDNSTRYLTPGLFVRVRVPASDPYKAMLVSERVIGTDRDKKVLLVVDKNGMAQSHEVQLG